MHFISSFFFFIRLATYCGNLQGKKCVFHIPQLNIVHNSPCSWPPTWPCGKASASRPAGPGSNPGFFCGTFPRLSHTSDLNIKFRSPMANLSGAWRYRVSARTGWPSVSMLWLGEMAIKFYFQISLSVAARTIVWVDPSLRHTLHVAGTLTNQETKASPFLMYTRLATASESGNNRA